MKKKELESLRALKNEIRLLEEELDNLPAVTDCVKGSMSEFPYIQVAIPVTGVDRAGASALKRKIEQKIKVLRSQLVEMEEWLDSVDDSEMRTILRLRYRGEMSWQQIAFEIGEFDESYPRRKVNRFLKAAES